MINIDALPILKYLGIKAGEKIIRKRVNGRAIWLPTRTELTTSAPADEQNYKSLKNKPQLYRSLVRMTVQVTQTENCLMHY